MEDSCALCFCVNSPESLKKVNLTAWALSITNSLLNALFSFHGQKKKLPWLPDAQSESGGVGEVSVLQS